MSSLRVLVVADDPLVRGGLAWLLAERSECEVIGQTSSGGLLADDLDAYQPDVLLWDVGWETGSLSGLERLASDDLSGAPPIVLLVPEDAPFARLRGLVQGLLLRDTDADRLVMALEAVTQGLVVFDPDLAAVLFPETEWVPDAPVEDLTAREMEVLQLIAEGLSNRAIAQRLGISEHTVKFHVTAIMGKLGAQSRTDAVVRATRLGLILL